MSKESLNKVLEQLMTDREFNRRVETAIQEVESKKHQIAETLFKGHNLTADEREALINKDFVQLQALGASSGILKRAEWCTGD